MIQCSKCGNQNNDTAHYCPKCGVPLVAGIDRHLYASFWRRTLACLFDHFIIFVSWAIIFGNSMETDKPAPDWVMAIYFAMILTYFTLLEGSPWQATLGKRIFQIVVADRNLRRIALWRSLIRNAAKFISSITFIGYLLPLFVPRKMALHDLMVQTVVIHRTAQVPAMDREPEASPDSQASPANNLPNPNAPKIKINSCSEEQLAALPGIGPELAKKAIEIRELCGDFILMEEFAKMLGLHPQTIDQLRPLIVFDKTTPQPDAGPEKGPNGGAIGV